VRVLVVGSDSLATRGSVPRVSAPIAGEDLRVKDAVSGLIADV
jgi:hypothetical protein